MPNKKVWMITGAARGMGVDFAKAALAAGHAVIATGRRPAAVAKALGASGDLLVAKLDVTSLADAEATAKAAVERFGRIDVLVNNAANFQAGYFEELTPEQVDRQLSTSLGGPMNVTRAILPVMRKQRSGHIISISSSAGLVGFEFCTAYSASKFGVEGWMESLHAERTVAQQSFWRSQNGKQSGDPAKLARALITIASAAPPPRRFIAGADAIATAEQKVADLQAQINAHRELSSSLAFEVNA